MNRATENRLRQLEAVNSPPRIIVVADDAEAERVLATEPGNILVIITGVPRCR
jgi:hypothetical protein